MGSDDIKTLIEQRGSDLADAYISTNMEKLMSYFSKDVDFSDIGMGASKLLTSILFLSVTNTPVQLCRYTTSTTPHSTTSIA